MTTSARLVLDDCRRAAEKLKACPTEEEARLYWVAAVTLLRTVGHVLKNVDGARSLELSNAINQLWSTVRKNPNKHYIFFEFIEHERNSVLKLYEFGPEILSITTSGIWEEKYGLFRRTRLRCEKSEDIFRPIFVGEDYDMADPDNALALVSEAIEWWEAHLTAIDHICSEPEASAAYT